jgi:diacylglycerol kinase family enzyme
MTRRLAAVLALLLPAATLVYAGGVIVRHFPDGLPVWACGLLAVAAALFGLVRRGRARIAGLAVAALALAAALVVLVTQDLVLENALILAGLGLALVAARAAFAVSSPLPAAPRPRHPVLLFNPRSGGGKAQRFQVAEEARARGIEPVELTPGDDLGALVRDALARGADALAMAGGDGSQAVVAGIAAERGLPYACIPAGTRNHFALDLGVDRDDVVGALDAFVDGGERLVDIADVNGRVFVNNVSLGLYADAVAREGYREAKLRTILDTIPDELGPGATAQELHWKGPEDEEHRTASVILISNNPYRLGRPLGSGTRPRIDEGVLGIAVVDGEREGGHRPRRLAAEWSAPTFGVAADGPVNAGIDGETVVLEAPLRFRSHPGALRVRVAAAHPGASPSAGMPGRARDVAAALGRIAAGREPGPTPTEGPTRRSEEAWS